MRFESPLHTTMTLGGPDAFELQCADGAPVTLRQTSALIGEPTRYLGNPDFVRMLLENVQDGVAIFRDGKQVFLNDRLCDIVGYPREELAALDPPDLVFEPEDRKRLHNLSEARRRGNAAPGILERRVLRKDGTIRNVRNLFVPVECLGARLSVLIMSDQTEHRRAAAEQVRITNELRRAHDLQQKLIDQSAHLIGLLAPDGTVIRANRTALALVGRPEHEVIGMPYWEGPWWTHDPSQQPEIREAIARAAAGETVRFVTTHRNDQGALRHIDFSLKPLRDDAGRVLHLIPEGRDITDQVVAEQARRESETMYTTLVENAGDAILVMQEGRFIRFNRRALALYGCSHDELLGKTPFDFSPPSQPDGRDSKQSSLENVALALAGTSRLFEWTHVRADGTQFPAEVALNAVRIRGGVIVQAIVRDLTARKQMEEELRKALRELTQIRDRLQIENVTLRSEVRTLHQSRHLVGESIELHRVMDQIQMVAVTDSTVLLLGETGTGKELVGAELHERSRRADRPLVRVNCAALPASLIENELFGRERGAYTGANARQLGRFEMASGSTILLDEIAEIPAETQVKILRVLQEREIERLGSSTPIKVDVRVIAATNKDLLAEVESGRFRADLFYRLNVFPIKVPPLRERRSDIPLLTWAFVEEFSKRMDKRIDALNEADLQELIDYAWPGNVRELRNVVERSMILHSGTILRLQRPVDSRAALPASHSRLQAATVYNTAEQLCRTDDSVEQLRRTVEACGWRIRGAGGAAELLGLRPTTLETRLAKLGIHRPGKRVRSND